MECTQYENCPIMFQRGIISFHYGTMQQTLFHVTLKCTKPCFKTLISSLIFVPMRNVVLPEKIKIVITCNAIITRMTYHIYLSSMTDIRLIINENQDLVCNEVYALIT